jgi:hypothetical protein
MVLNNYSVFMADMIDGTKKVSPVYCAYNGLFHPSVGGEFLFAPEMSSTKVKIIEHYAENLLTFFGGLKLPEVHKLLEYGLKWNYTKESVGFVNERIKFVNLRTFSPSAKRTWESFDTEEVIDKGRDYLASAYFENPILCLDPSK